MDEFDLIRRYFAPLARTPGADGLRDDVAEIALQAGKRLIVTADAIVEGVHFLPDDPLSSVAGKLVRVNVSDIIAKGGHPAGALLSLAWPKGRDPAGLEEFATRLGEDLASWGGHLLGGDTTSTSGPLTLSLTLTGWCGVRGPVRRNGAQAGEDIWVSGPIGDGWLGLQAALGGLGELSAMDRSVLVDAYRLPKVAPLALADVIAAHGGGAIDISDGLAQDAEHLSEASGVALVIDPEAIPLSMAARRWLAASADRTIAPLLGGGDDYQAVFSAPATVEARQAIREAGLAMRIDMRRIGRVEPGTGVRFVGTDGSELHVEGGWRHAVG
jgi:thiamine-monophosphate kinase